MCPIGRPRYNESISNLTAFRDHTKSRCISGSTNWSRSNISRSCEIDFETFPILGVASAMAVLCADLYEVIRAALLTTAAAVSGSAERRFQLDSNPYHPQG